MTIEKSFLQSAIKRLSYYKELGDKTFAQLTDADFHYQPNEDSNCIAIIIQHTAGNMLSRWTDFLTSDGEKSWRNREAEFDEAYADKQSMMDAWEKGWSCLFTALESVKTEDLSKIIYIRNEGQSVLEAIQRQLAHYPHHVGQILYQAKIIKGDSFKSLSIPKGNSEAFNKEKFEQEKARKHFTDGLKK